MRSSTMLVAVLSLTTIMRRTASRNDTVSPSVNSLSTPEPETLVASRSVKRSSQRALPTATCCATAQAMGSLMVLAVRTGRSASIATSAPVSRLRA